MGEFPINSCLTYSFKTLIRMGAGGPISNDAVASPSDRAMQCVNGEIVDINDLDGDSNTADSMCKTLNPASFLVPNI